MVTAATGQCGRKALLCVWDTLTHTHSLSLTLTLTLTLTLSLLLALTLALALTLTLTLMQVSVSVSCECGCGCGCECHCERECLVVCAALHPDMVTAATGQCGRKALLCVWDTLTMQARLPTIPCISGTLKFGFKFRIFGQLICYSKVRARTILQSERTRSYYLAS